MNAIKHGMRCETVAPPDDAKLIAETVATWIDQLHPIGALEQALIESAATAAARLQRCREVEADAIAKRVREAGALWEELQRESAAAIGAGLAEDPAATVELLECSSFGCEWLMARWLDLEAELEPGHCWSNLEAFRALGLLGLDPARQGPKSAAVWRAVRAMAPDQGDAAAREAARATLLRIVADELARLEALARKLWAEVEAPLLAEARRLARFDDSQEALLRFRYEVSHQRHLSKCIDQLGKIRSSRIDPGPRSCRDGRAVSERRADGAKPAAQAAAASGPGAEVPADPPVGSGGVRMPNEANRRVPAWADPAARGPGSLIAGTDFEPSRGPGSPGRA